MGHLLKYKSALFKPHDARLITSLTCVVLLWGILGCKGKTSEQAAATEIEESITTKIKIKDLNNEVIELSQHRGKTIFINFWATWCGPCIKEMPSIERAKTILKDRNITFMVASNEPIEQIQGFATKRNLDLHYVQLQNLEELNIPALPTTYIISPAGELVFSETGYREWDEAANIELLTKIIDGHE
jgi:thiol-disulfide isomerase/thioredoxin